MKPLKKTAYSCWTRLLYLGKKRCNILILPEEIIVDEIFQYLTVYDILRLRRVCKPLSVMTKKPAVWKRLLPHLSEIDQPLAPLPPTKAYNMRNLTALDMETIVARALSYDIEWKKKRIFPVSHFGGFSFHAVTDMCLLPGGHFLVTSQEYDDAELGMLFIVSLWSLQHPATNRPAAIAYRITAEPPYGLTAKYMTINGEKGIAVGFLRKKNKNPKDPRPVPRTFELGGKMDAEDPFQPLKYECTVLHIKMSVIDILTDRNIAPSTRKFQALLERLGRGFKDDIWRVVGRIRTASQLGPVSLDRIDGRPFVCLLKRPNTIVFQRLDDGVRSSIQCQNVFGYAANTHVTYNFRVLPDQNEVLVIRNIEKRDGMDVEMKFNHTAFERYQLPQPGESRVSEAVEFDIPEAEEEIIHVQISETYRKMPTHEDESITPYLNQDHIQAISVYLRTELTMVHIAIYPSSVDPSDSPPDVALSAQDPVKKALYKTPRRKFHYDFLRMKKSDFTANEALKGTNPYAMEEYDTPEELKAAEREEWKFPVDARLDDHLRFLPGAYRGILYHVPRRWTSIDPPVTCLFGFELDSKDHAYYDYVAHMGMEDAIYYTEITRMEEQERAGRLNANRKEELEVMMMLRPEGRERNNYRHPTLQISPAKPPSGRHNMIPIALGDEYLDLMGFGVQAICFDEDVGRLVISTKKDKKFHVFDFAHHREKDDEDVLVARAVGMQIDG